MVTFTGSAATGKMLKALPQFSERSIPFNLEADSLNATVLGKHAQPGTPEFDLFIKETVKEIIFALSPTMEGDTTNFYLFKKLQRFECLITSISRGIAVGSELQYADELTLGRSLQQRQVFQSGH